MGTHAGDLISEVALAVEMGADVIDIAKTIHPHPTLGESVGMAAEVAEGVCTDLPPMKKKQTRFVCEIRAAATLRGDFCLADAGARRVLWGTAPEGADKDGQICHCRPDRDGGPALCSRPGCAGMWQLGMVRWPTHPSYGR